MVTLGSMGTRHVGLSGSMVFPTEGPAKAERAEHFWNPAGLPKYVPTSSERSEGCHHVGAFLCCKGTSRGELQGLKPSSWDASLALCPWGCTCPKWAHVSNLTTHRETFAFSNWYEVAL